MLQIPKYASFTRPDDTTAYTQFDIVSNSTDGGTALQFAGGVPGKKCNVVRCLAQKSANTASATDMALVLFRADPGVVNDNGALTAVDFDADNRFNYVGSVAIAAFTAGVGTTGAQSDNIYSSPLSIADFGPNDTLYGVLLAKNSSPYTPAALENYSITLFLQPEQ